MERRDSHRVLASNLVTVWSDGKSPLVACELHDVSVTGCGLYYPRRLEAHSRIYLGLQLTGGMDYPVWGTVVRSGSRKQVITGIEFEQSEQAYQRSLFTQLLRTIEAADLAN